MKEAGAAVSIERLRSRIASLGRIGAIGATSASRPAMSALDAQARETVRSWMEEAGMKARVDAFGNLIGRMEGKEDGPVLMLGSHIDTQPNAGLYDGVAGVVGAIEAVQLLRDSGEPPQGPVEVAVFSDEEGCRFDKGLFGSRGLAGRLEEGELDRTDAQGVTRREALLTFGGDPGRFAEDACSPGAVKAYLELHIEQGPVLESLNASCGLVTGISGPLWWTVELRGFAGHAGSVPMAMRRDALAGAAAVIAGLQDLLRGEEGSPAVGTVGSLHVYPNSRNVIPERVRFTVDLRDMDMSRRGRLERRLRLLIADKAADNGLEWDLVVDTDSEPRYCDPDLMAAVREAAAEAGLPLPELMSGPFHDALAMSHVCPYAMIFIRSRDGISHNPLEYSSPEDIAAGTELLARTLMRLAARPPYGEGGRRDGNRQAEKL
ncbi:Zn-dependent hydrolase [Paenibacillus sp. P22]|uniref:Zn-dependent hydrolase n=1 Tax=Paenibacillus sp. P22 TaxID=483908 RepID=UPI00065F917A|nr:Zn-dependent hydrolase [Paenibacillus sp. P22]